ncbi:hypothetical protein V1506DRAFT_550109 [Lipomyces tetrasporus]
MGCIRMLPLTDVAKDIAEKEEGEYKITWKQFQEVEELQLDVLQPPHFTHSLEQSIATQGNSVSRAYSDVTDLVAFTTKCSQGESNVVPIAITIPSSTATTTTTTNTNTNTSANTSANTTIAFASFSSSSYSSTSSSSSSSPFTISSDAASASPGAKRVTGRNSVQSTEVKRPCTICKKWFKNLEDHLWTHSPEPRPHKCRAGYTDGKPTCQYVTMGFARVADRDRHESKHYDGRFVCPFGIENCRTGNERFGRLDTFKRHLRTVHGKSPASARSDGRCISTAPPLRLSARGRPRPPRRRHRIGKLQKSNDKLLCYNCKKSYDGVQAFSGHLNDCTCALMHEWEADESADFESDDSD